MSEDHLERVLGQVSVNRRSFIKKLVVGTAFAMPVVASFEMLGSSSTADGVTCTASNGGAGTSATGTAGGAGGSRRNQASGACGGTPDGATGGASSGGVGASDRNLKTAVTPVVWF